MAVVTIYMSDRDKTGKTFVSKKDADEHDKKLELAENFSVFLGQRLSFLNDKQSEEIGILLAEHRELLMNALKGRPEALLEADATPTIVAAVTDAAAFVPAAPVPAEEDSDTPPPDKKVRSIAR